MGRGDGPGTGRRSFPLSPPSKLIQLSTWGVTSCWRPHGQVHRDAQGSHTAQWHGQALTNLEPPTQSSPQRNKSSRPARAPRRGHRAKQTGSLPADTCHVHISRSAPRPPTPGSLDNHSAPLPLPVPPSPACLHFLTPVLSSLPLGLALPAGTQLWGQAAAIAALVAGTSHSPHLQALQGCSF